MRTKPPFSYYTDQMWRYFIPRWKWNVTHPEQPVVYQTYITERNYKVCAAIWDGLTEEQRTIMTTIHTTPHEELPFRMEQLSERLNRPVRELWHESYVVTRLTGERMQLVEERGSARITENHGAARPTEERGSTGLTEERSAARLTEKRNAAGLTEECGVAGRTTKH